MTALNTLVVRLSQSRKAVVLIAVAFGVAFLLLMLAASSFRSAVGGLEPFDLQNGLTPAEVREQLARYGDSATGRYLAFTAVDWFFPLLGGLLTAVIAAACLRNSFPQLYARAVSWRLFALFFLPTLFDWTENVFALWLVLGGSPPSSTAVNGLLLAKQFKLFALVIVQTATALAIAGWIVMALRRRIGQHR